MIYKKIDSDPPGDFVSLHCLISHF